MRSKVEVFILEEHREQGSKLESLLEHMGYRVVWVFQLRVVRPEVLIGLSEPGRQAVEVALTEGERPDYAFLGETQFGPTAWDVAGPLVRAGTSVISILTDDLGHSVLENAVRAV